MSFQLETAFTFSDTIKPICLANGILQNNFKPAPAVISGWGQTSGKFYFLFKMTWTYDYFCPSPNFHKIFVKTS